MSVQQIELIFLQLNVSEVRFFGRTASDSQTLHFKTWSTSLISYLATGAGSWGRMQFPQVALLEGHNASLPATTAGAKSNRGDLAAVDYPFYSSLHSWVPAPPYWQMDDVSVTNQYNTQHQMWIRPHVWPMLSEANVSDAPLIVSGSVPAVMNSNDATLVVTLATTALADTCWSLPLPMNFKMFGANYGNGNNGGVYVCDDQYITFGAPTSGVITGFTALQTGVALLFGAADRLLVHYAHISGSITTNTTTNTTSSNTTDSGVSYTTALLRYSATNLVNSHLVDLELTFAVDAAYQYIELRVGASSSYNAVNGTWGVNDGFLRVQNLSAVPPGASVVFQSDLQGRAWQELPASHLDLRLPKELPANLTGRCSIPVIRYCTA